MIDAFGVDRSEIVSKKNNKKYRKGRGWTAAGIGGATGTVLAGPLAGLLGAGVGAGASLGYDHATWEKRKAKQLALKQKARSHSR